MKRSTSWYRRKVSELLVIYKRAGIKVRFVTNKVLADFGGMNDEAAKKFGFRRLPDDTILIDKGMHLKDQYETLLHECEEMVRMEKLHKQYWPEHEASLKVEKKGLSKFVKAELKKGV